MVTRQKRMGAHFTPTNLANFVAQRLAAQIASMSGRIRILDPACGDGNLLHAIADALPKRMLRRCELIGIEHDRMAYTALQARFAAFRSCTTDLILGDFLSFFDDHSLFDSKRALGSVDVIIANPPYVRTQVLGAKRAQQLAYRFGLSGRVDLYQAFLVAMEKQLRPGGLLGVITSNRFLTTKSGATTRRFLRSQFDIIEIVDLGDTKLFEAAVLPALVFAVKRDAGSPLQRRSQFKFVRVYEEVGITRDQPNPAAASVMDLVRSSNSGLFAVNGTSYRVARGVLTVPEDESRPWTMLTRDEGQWVRHIDAHAVCRLKEVARIRVGIKTTADSVYIGRDWSVLPAEERPERSFLKPLISQEDAARWRAKSLLKSRKSVLYTHEMVDGKRQPIRFAQNSPTWKYLLRHRKKLESRSYVIEAGRQWYEIWVPQNPDAWRIPKIVFPDISPEPRFFLDRERCLVDGNCYWITTQDPEDEELLLLILGVVNSSVIMRYHELAFPNKLYSQRRRHLTQYVQEYPLPDRELPESKQIVELVRCLTSGERLPCQHVSELESRIDCLLATAFALGDGLITDRED